MLKIKTPFGEKCSFCETGHYVTLTDKTNSKDRYCMQLSDNKLEILKQTGISAYWDFILITNNKIEYCPFCGRNLESKGE